MRATRTLYNLLLLWLVVLPWPLGANRDALWLGFSALLFALGAWALWLLPLADCWRHTDRWLRLALLALAGILALDLGRLLLARFATAPSSPWRLADPDAAAFGAIQSAGVLVLAMLLALLVRSRRRARWLLLAVFASGVAEALLAIGVALSGGGLHWLGHRLGDGGNASGTLINRNHFAGLLELAGAAGFGLLASGIAAHPDALSLRERIRRIGHALLGERFAVRAGLALVVVALVLSRSRMGNVGLFFGLTVAGLAALAWWRPLPRLLLWLLLSILVVDVAVLGAWVGVDKVAERLAETRIVAVELAPADPAEPTASAAVTADRPVRLEPSDAERWTVARATWTLWRQRPLLGHGAGSFRVLFPAVKPASVQLFYEHAHNDYLELLVERGLLGLGLWLLAVLTPLALALRVLRRHQDSLHRGLAVASIAAGSALLLHGLVDFNQQIPANRWWFHALILAGALASQVPRRLRRAHAADADTGPG
ncbi:MAG: O-antigen ligase family protein [Lysobacterales bacterium]